MPAQEIARQWFIPGEGIDRHVISADIQRYLGNDATVRPGQGTGENQGVQGYWIKAYRNLTSAMIADLRADSARWRQEQRMTGTRGSSSPVISDKSGFTVPDQLIEPYVGSRTYEASAATNAARTTQRRDGDSPSLEGPYGVPPPRSSRSQVDPMQIDPPVPRADARYGQPQQPGRNYPQDNGGYPAQSRERYPDAGRPPFQQDQPMSDAYGRGPPVASAYTQDSNYAPGYGRNDNAPPGYVRQGDYFVPITSSYGQPSIMATSRQEPQQFPSGPYGQPQVPPTRDPREQRDPRDPRYGQPEYNDPRYAYPSPATTVSSVGPREPISSPQQPSPYSQVPPQYDQYGQPIRAQPSLYGPSDPGYQQPSRDPTYGRERQPAPGGSDRDRQRRRH